MADAPPILSDLSNLADWAKQNLLRLTPPGQQAPKGQRQPIAPEAAPVDNVPGPLPSILDAFRHPINTINAVTNAITPSDTIPLPSGATNAEEYWKKYAEDHPRGQEPTMAQRASLAAERQENPWYSNLAKSFIPQAALDAFHNAQGKGTSPQQDITGTAVVNHDTSTLLPMILAGARTVYDLSPAENIMNVIRGAKVDPTTGQEVPLSGPEFAANLETIGMKASLLSKSHVKMPNLEETLSGSTAENLNPIINDTRFIGEIKATQKAQSMNKEEAADKEGLRLDYNIKAARTLHGEDEDITAGSAPIPLDDRGHASMQVVADGFPQATKIVTSDVKRSIDSAAPLIKKFPDAYQQVDANWDAMHKASLEGQPTTLANQKLIEMAKNTPDEPIPGMSPVSKDVGESWNSFTDRITKASQMALQDWERNPEATHIIYTHSDVLKGIGSLEDGVIDPDKFLAQEAGSPGTIYRYARGKAEPPTPLSYEASQNPETALTLQPGVRRLNKDGSTQILDTIPIEHINGDPGNTIYEDTVAKYQQNASSLQSELRPDPDTPGDYIINEGHHRILAQVRNGATEINAWRPEIAEDIPQPEVPGKPTLFKVGPDDPKTSGLFLVRHGETPWDPKSEAAGVDTLAKPGASGIVPQSLEDVAALRAKLPQSMQDSYLQQLPRVGWVQQRVGEWVDSGAMLQWMQNYDPANKASDPIHAAAAFWHANSEAKAHYVNDLSDNYGIPPDIARGLVSGEMEVAPQYAGQVNNIYSQAIQNFKDNLEVQRQQGNFGQAFQAQKTLDIVNRYQKLQAEGIQGTWNKTTTLMNQIENLRRSELVSNIATAINIAKSHGLITLTDGSDAIMTSMLKLVTNSGKYISDAITQGKFPEKPYSKTFKDAMGDAHGFFNGIMSRTPWIPDVGLGMVHHDPSVYGITPEIYNAIRKDADDGMLLSVRAKAGKTSPETILNKYSNPENTGGAKLSRDQLDQIINGSSHRNIVNDLLSASPIARTRILGGYVFDTDTHLFGPQAALFGKALTEAFNNYKDHAVVGEQVRGLKAAWESGKTTLPQIWKAMPVEAWNGKGGVMENISAMGQNVFQGAKLGVDFLNTANRLQMTELSRLQYHIHFTQELNRMGISEDQALAAMRDESVQRDPKTGMWTPVPVDPRLKEAAATAELATMKNTLRFQPKGGILGSLLDANKYIGQKIFPTTPFALTFPRYVANFINYTAAHSPTKLVDLFNPEFRAKLMDKTSEGSLQSQEGFRQLGRGMTGLAVIAAGYAMSQGHSIAGYTMGSKPYLLDRGEKDADGNPKYLNIDSIGPVNSLFHLGHITDALLNQKPINLDTDEWQNFLTGAKVTDAALFGVSDAVKEMNQQQLGEPNTRPMQKFAGGYLGSWLHFWKGAQDDANASRDLFNLGPGASKDYLTTRNTVGQPLAGPTLQNTNPGSLPVRVNPFNGKILTEEHPLQALFKFESKPMYPTEKWMTELGIPTYKISDNTGDPVANNKINQFTGWALENPDTSRQIVNKAVGLDLPIEQLYERLKVVAPLKGPLADQNRQFQTEIFDAVNNTLHETVKDAWRDQAQKDITAGQPSPILIDEWLKQQHVTLPYQKEELHKKLKALGVY